MSTALRKQAEELAARSYAVVIMQDETTEGKPVIAVSHPDLPGCRSHGKTIQEALTNLEDARVEYILSLLEDELPVPTPAQRPIGSYGTFFGGHLAVAALNFKRKTTSKTLVLYDFEDDTTSQPMPSEASVGDSIPTIEHTSYQNEHRFTSSPSPH